MKNIIFLFIALFLFACQNEKVTESGPDYTTYVVGNVIGKITFADSVRADTLRIQRLDQNVIIITGKYVYPSSWQVAINKKGEISDVSETLGQITLDANGNFHKDSVPFFLKRIFVDSATFTGIKY